MTSHPLDPMSETEVHTVKRILEREGLLGESVRFAFFGLGGAG
jgi:Cu2+-containing amine oxidase